MSSITSLISGGGGGGTPVNSIVRLSVGGEIEYTDEFGGVYLKTGNFILTDESTYPDAYFGPNIGAASFTQLFSVSAQETAPTGIAFNNDGTKMFIVGYTGDDVNEYALSTGFDVSTASFTDSFSVAAQDNVPVDIAFNNDGTKMFIVGFTGKDVNEYSLSTGFDVSTASFTDSFSVSAQETSPEGIAFNNDGTKMYIVGTGGDRVYEYALSTGFDVSTASFTNSFSVSSQETDPAGIAFNNDGTKMYIVGYNGKEVNEYVLSTGFDVSTASFTQLFSVSAQENDPAGIAFNNDGTKMFIVGLNGQEINEYDILSIMGEPNNTGVNDYLKLK
jgi:DNA-binding beta-propeller fold protein YncE